VLILSFGAVFAGVGLVSQNDNYLSSLAILIGIFGGSAIWWVLLSGTFHKLRMKFSDVHIQKINQLSGVLIVCFGIIILGCAILF
jgi:hypothetical protein